ncbi:MAG: hypothetical protein WHU94_03635 [Thermogemmata sp.]|nr:caspase family protein [Gemmataceae bacterium]
MSAIMRGRCPSCQAVLRIPSHWLTQTLRCRNCGAVVRPRGVSTSPISGHEVNHGQKMSSSTSTAIPASAWLATSPGGTNGLPGPVVAPGTSTGYVLPAAVPPATAPAGMAHGGGYVSPAMGQTLPPPGPAIQPPSRYRGPRSVGQRITPVLVFLLAVALLGGGLYYFRNYLQQATSYAGNRSKDAESPKVLDKGKESGDTLARGVAAASFPRRLLFLSIDNYMFLNPLTSAPPGQGDRVRSLANRWAFEWRIPMDKENHQVFVLSDTLPERLLPVKSVLIGTYESFFQSCRAQDRVVIYFSGHAQFRDGAAYLAPMEADPDDPASFIPLADFYDKLRQCRATQKVVIWDVCRYNPERGIIRPGSEPMSQELFTALQASPPGVEVIITCQPGENALEFSSVTLSGGPRTTTYAGSAFLIAARIAAERKKGVVTPPHPDDPLPVSEWVAEVQQRLQEVLEAVHMDRKQTLQVHGARPAQLVASNSQESPAAAVVIPSPPKTASPAEVASITSEFQLPPLKDDLGQDNIANFPFDPQLLAAYRDTTTIQEVMANKERYRLRAAVLQAFDEIRDIWKGNPAGGGTGQLPDVIKAPITDELKKEIFAGLDFYALGIARLELIDTTLDSLESLRDGETKRWQAHYDYARAAVKTRLAFLNEYNKVMGLVRTNTLPNLDPKLGQNQYKLASSNRMRSGKEVERMVQQAREIYARIITEHRGTPWAIQAKREKNLSLGLMWQPSSDKKADE